MVPEDLRGRRVLLDACCLINLFASGRIEEILSTLPCQFFVAEKVTEEALFILPEDEVDDTLLGREAISTQVLVIARLVQVIRPESEEEEAVYVDLATVLDDGEAMTCALAILRNYDVATDERKAIRVLSQHAPHVVMHTTASLVKAWADAVEVGPQVLRLTLQSIQLRGRFRPGRQEPLRLWWESSLREE